jgi:hypothetical protein
VRARELECLAQIDFAGRAIGGTAGADLCDHITGETRGH